MSATRQGDDAPFGTARPSHLTQLSGVLRHGRTSGHQSRVTARLEWPGGDHRWRWSGDIPADSCVRFGTLQTVVPEADGPLCLDLELHLSRRDVIVNRYRSTIAR
jgi:hypothetical protein